MTRIDGVVVVGERYRSVEALLSLEEFLFGIDQHEEFFVGRRAVARVEEVLQGDGSLRSRRRGGKDRLTRG